MKIMLLLLCLVAITSINAQTKKQGGKTKNIEHVQSTKSHMKFMGIPIDGTLNQFATKLQSKGFKIKDKEASCYSMSGKFSNEKVEILVSASPKSRIVSSVMVFFPTESSWDTLSSKYFKYKDLLAEKYNLFKSIEEFYDDTYETLGYQILAFESDKARYVALYNCDEGGVSLSIGYPGTIQILYMDGINSKIRDKEEESLISNDL